MDKYMYRIIIKLSTPFDYNNKAFRGIARLNNAIHRSALLRGIYNIMINLELNSSK